MATVHDPLVPRSTEVWNGIAPNGESFSTETQSNIPPEAATAHENDARVPDADIPAPEKAHEATKDSSLDGRVNGEIQEAKVEDKPSPAQEERDRYKHYATRLASKATEEEINFIAKQIEAMNARKEALEEFLEEAKKDLPAGSETSDADSTPAKLPEPIAEPKLKFVDWDDFMNVNWCDCSSFNEWALEKNVRRQPAAIEVLIGNARQFWQKDPEEWAQFFLPLSSSKASEQSSKEGPSVRGDGGLPVVPERIRINSRPLLRFLLDLIKKPDDDPYSTVMLRPYKILLHHENAIREYYKELEEKWAHKVQIDDDSNSKTDPVGKDATNEASPPSSSTAEASTVENNPSSSETLSQTTNSPESELKDGDKKEEVETNSKYSLEAWRDMGCLLEFIDKHVHPAVELFGGNQVKKARFQDLWYLFKPGDDIIVNEAPNRKAVTSFHRATRSSEKHPVWRVFNVTGGRPLLSSSRDGIWIQATRAPAKRIVPFSVLAYRIIFDGQTFGPVAKAFSIDPFDGERDISSLEVYPLRFSSNRQIILKDLEESGRKFTELTTASPRNYNGPTLNIDHSGSFCIPAGDTVSQISGQVVVDFEEARQDNPDWVQGHSVPRCFEPEERELDPSSMANVTCWKDEERKEMLDSHSEGYFGDLPIDEERTEEYLSKDVFFSAYKAYKDNEDQLNLDGSSLSQTDLLLLPNQVCAFVLKRRQFALLSMDGLEPFKKQEKGWEELKLPKGHKDMVEAQALSHFRDKERRALARQRDLIPGKGQGLIVLLHGCPGVGKTSTAECIALKLGYPLYPITCGDLGTTVEVVEKRLEAIFSKAQKWNCVLLLDEADVFLAERTKTDIERNALVSLFLRTLEYYDGLLFLTTNRVGTLDEAFKSRIHMTLYYPPLKKAQMKAIWEVNLKRIQSYRDDVDPQFKEILDFPETLWADLEREGRTQWNGRQIRNAFQTALALAENDFFKKYPNSSTASSSSTDKKIVLDKSHFTTVAHTINTFDDYLDTAHHGNSDSKRAYDRGQRADRWGQQQQRQAAAAAAAPPPPPQAYNNWYYGNPYGPPPPGPSVYGPGGAPPPPPSPTPTPAAPNHYEYWNHGAHAQAPQNHHYHGGYATTPPPPGDSRGAQQKQAGPQVSQNLHPQAAHHQAHLPPRGGPSNSEEDEFA